MTAFVSYSGGCSHKNDVPPEKQKEHAVKIANEIKEVLERNHCSGGISVTVGQQSTSASAMATTAIDD